MENQIFIKEIKIKNFRSIRNMSLTFSNMNIFVGLNDVGKSNVLKALNLFFNNKTDYDTDYNFDRDFSYLFPQRSHSTKEILIELTVVIPDSFQNSGVYHWKKSWRKNSTVTELITNEKGKSPSPRSRIPGTLRRIKFRYVPAVKSKDFYKYLLSELYLTAASSLDSPLITSTMDFVNVIQDYTMRIHDEVSDKIGISSQLSIPTDMTDIFKSLIFITNDKDGEISIPLDMRGDGIQSRHIPIILSYLAEQDLKSRNQGSAKITTIWGYEEPENGVELLKCFDLAKSFHNYAQDIQLFITTHSPAFYQQNAVEDTRVFYVKKNDSMETIILDSFDDREIGISMGLMPLVAPYIEEKQQEINRLLDYNNEHLLKDRPTIFVEGKTDKEYITLAAALFSPRLNELLNNGELIIYTKNAAGGCLAINDWVHIWMYNKYQSKTLVIFDKDEAGARAHDLLTNSQVYTKYSRSNKIKTVYLEPSNEIKSIFQKNIFFTYEIEHLLSTNCWNKMKQLSYVKERSGADLIKMLGPLADKNRTAVDVFESIVPEESIRETIIYYEPKSHLKNNILNLVKNASATDQKEYMYGFNNLIKALEDRFIS